MSKVILLSRVSTVQQTLEQQTDELVNESKRLGYKESDIIIIEDKESGISLDEQEREGLNKLKGHIENDNEIDCVICYEVSRLSRRPKVLYSIRDYLIERKIQLIILKPYMRLLENDGKMSQTASIMFSLFSSLSESEMMIKKERMMRGKRIKMKNNIYCGGHISIGYKVDENRNIIIDEEKASLIRKMFDMYSSGNYSIRKLTIELMEQGDLKFENLETAITFVNQTLKRKQYYGDCTDVGYNYPPIISKLTFDKCSEIFKRNVFHPRFLTKMVYYCKGLVFCGHDNRMMSANRSRKVYSVTNFNNKSTISISLNVLDSLVWHVVKEQIIYHSPEDTEKLKSDLNNAIDILNKKVITGKQRKNELITQIDRIENRIIQGKLDEARGDRMEMEIKQQIDEIEQNIHSWMFEVQTKENELKEINNDMYVLRDLNVLNDEEIYSAIKKYIDKIIIWKSGTKGTFDCDIIFNVGIIKTFKVTTITKVPKILDEYGEQINIEILTRLPTK